LNGAPTHGEYDNYYANHASDTLFTTPALSRNSPTWSYPSPQAHKHTYVQSANKQKWDNVGSGKKSDLKDMVAPTLLKRNLDLLNQSFSIRLYQTQSFYRVPIALHLTFAENVSTRVDMVTYINAVHCSFKS